jgi:hypothetical protein
MGMTNKEKFKEVFGLEIDDTSDCGFFNCTDRACKDCPVKDTKDWWNAEYKEPKTGHWNDIPNYKDIAWRCSECKHFAAMKHNYCPCCGARMVEPQERSDKK